MNCVDCEQELDDGSYVTVQVGEVAGQPILEADIPLCTTCLALRAYMAREKRPRKR